MAPRHPGLFVVPGVRLVDFLSAAAKDGDARRQNHQQNCEQKPHGDQQPSEIVVETCKKLFVKTLEASSHILLRLNYKVSFETKEPYMYFARQ